ncbi:MAG: hypothetical protein PVH40_06690 [Gemmatimonadales bacterium]|jgi:hypothetical protein
MKQLMVSALLAGLVAMLPHPTPADAREDDRLAKCLAEAITECDRDFDGDEIYVVAARGYCYMIRTGMCYALDPYRQ